MEIIQIILNTSFIFLLIYFLGNVFTLPFLFSENLEVRVFNKLLCGVIASIGFPAIFLTSFQTINILLLPIFAWIVWKHTALNFKNIQLRIFPSISETKILVSYLAVLVLIIFMQFYRLDYFNHQITHLSDPDFSYYISVAEYLFETGKENTSGWYELIDLSSTDKSLPYHYGDLWLLGSIIQLSAVASLKTFLYIFIPICVVIGFSGLNALSSSIVLTRRSFEIIVLCFLIGFSIGHVPLLREAYGFYNSPLTTPKVFLFFVLMLQGFLFFKENKFQLFVITISLIPIFHILYAPIIFTALFLWSGILYLKWKEKKYLFGMICPAIIAIGIVAFYFLFGEHSSYYSDTSHFDWSKYVQDFFITTFRNIIVRTMVFYIPLGILYFLLWKNRELLLKAETSIFGFVLTMVLTTIVFRGLLNHNVESLQIYHIVFNPLFIILYLYAFSLFLKHHFFYGKYRRIVYFLIIFQAVSSFFIILQKFPQRYDSVSNQFLTEIEIELREVEPMGVFITTPDSMDVMKVSAHLCFFAMPLKLTGKKKWVNSISIPEDIEILKFPERRSGIEKSPFFKFIQWQKQNNVYLNYEKAQVDFIKKYRVEYVLLEKGVILSEELEGIIERVIEDESTGVRIGIFKEK